MLRKTLFTVLAIFLIWNIFSFYNVFTAKDFSLESEQSADEHKVDIKSGNFTPIPLAFIKNSGELNNKVKYYEKGAGHTTLFTKNGVYISLSNSGEDKVKKVKTVKISPINKSSNLRIEKSGIQKGTLNYLVGNDPSKWQQGIQTYKKVIYREIYDGIDMKFYGNNNQLEYDVVVKPGADPSAVRLRYDGIRNLKKDDKGNLEILLVGGKIIQSKPRIFQIINDEYINVEGSFKVFNDNLSHGFEVASYNKDYPLIIDPLISYSSFLGGSNDEKGNAVAVDSSGNLYIVGKTTSTNFPLQSAFQSVLTETSYEGVVTDVVTADAFITKVDSTGNTLIFSTFFGGNNDDSGDDIAVDSAGNVYITGKTFSSNLPVSTTIQTTFAGAKDLSDAFVAKLDSSGATVEYLTYLGGSGNDSATGIAIDSSGNAYVGGVTASTDFPITSAFQSVSGGGTSDAFVAKINSTGTSLTYSSYLGGSDSDAVNDIAVDSSGNALVTGDTISSNFPTASPLYPSKSTLTDIFISKVNPTGSALVYSTYFGGNDGDTANGIAVDSDRNAYIAGTTYSNDLPVMTDAIQASIAGNGDGTTTDIFVVKVISTGNSVDYATYLGGAKDDSGNGIAVDSAGNAYIVGDSNSTDFPTKAPSQQSKVGQIDTVVAKIDSTGKSLSYSTYFGGGKDDVGLAIAVDQKGYAYITGYTKTVTDFPLSTSLQTANGGLYDAFLAKFDPIITGTIEVRTNLDEATFSILGPENFNSTGKLWTTEAIAGVYTITMDAVEGYKTPNTKSKTLSVGETLIFSKTYASTTGVITVTTNLDSAAFTVSGPATYNGTGKLWTQTGAPEGEYTITFTNVVDYKTPDSQTDTLAGGGGITFDATYLPESAPDFKYKKVNAPKSAKRGKKVKIAASVKNIGAEKASSSIVNFYLSKKKAKTIDENAIKIGKKSVSAINSGRSKSIVFKKKIKNKTKKGKYYVKAEWDGKDAILESNESNNVGRSSKKLKLK